MKNMIMLLLVVLVVVAGCQMPTTSKEYGRVYCDDLGFEDTDIKVTRNPDKNTFVVDCNYTEEDMLEEIEVVKEISDDRFELEKK